MLTARRMRKAIFAILQALWSWNWFSCLENLGELLTLLP